MISLRQELGHLFEGGDAEISRRTEEMVTQPKDADRAGRMDSVVTDSYLICCEFSSTETGDANPRTKHLFSLLRRKLLVMTPHSTTSSSLIVDFSLPE